MAGGKLAILAWSSECLLPGHPLLEARLRTTTPGLAPASAGMAPSRHFLRALGWLRELGLGDPGAHVFSGSVHAPLSDEQLKALESLFDMRWPGAEAELEESELCQLQQAYGGDRRKL